MNENLTKEEQVALEKAIDDAEKVYYENVDAWTEMDEDYFNALRKEYNKGPDEIGPRKFKSFIHSELPLYILIFPAGKQHNGGTMIQYYHTITEDLEYGECNGSYKLITETELFEKFNIKYNK